VGWTINAMPDKTELRLRAPQLADEQVARRALDELAADGFDFAWWPAGESWADRVAWFANTEAGRNVPPGWIPNVFRFAEVDGQVVGRTSVRFALNEALLAHGGHIGYAVRPAFRRRGHATTILLRSIELGRAAGLDRILVTCDKDNIGSRTVIERCGGVLDPDWPHHQTTSGTVVNRYWIPDTARSA
jgi:predicted acetyltransferase